MLANTKYFVFDASKESVEGHPSRNRMIRSGNESFPSEGRRRKPWPWKSDAGTGWLASRLLRLLCSFPLVSRRRRRIPPDLPHPTTSKILQLPAIHLIMSRCTLKLVKPVRMPFKDAIALHWTVVCLIKKCKYVLDLSVHIICMCVEYLQETFSLIGLCSRQDAVVLAAAAVWPTVDQGKSEVRSSILMQSLASSYA